MRHLSCPVCEEALELTENEKSLVCSNGHTFDKAKQGYANLLLSHQKKSKNPGDTLEMVAARTRFLNKGYYKAVADSISSIVKNEAKCSNESELSYCDIACGEGYYTSILHSILSETNAVSTTGFDISTHAIKAACKRNKFCQWLVASANKIPVEHSSQDILSCLFCRVDYDAAALIAKPNALFIVAETGPTHLIELREKLYDELSEEKEKPYPTSTTSFKYQSTEKISTKILIEDTCDIHDLLTMTPHYWRVKPERKERLQQLNQLETTLDIRFHLFRREPN